jgi:predicted MFS family arabinose efflux permease
VTVAAAPRLSRRLVALMAVATGAAVANNWLIQPVLNDVQAQFGVSEAVAGLLITVVQVGYVFGLAFVVPLGDLLERRGLITGVLCGTAVAAGLCAAAPTIGVLFAALTVLGVTTCVAQLLVPLASTLAGPQERGHVVGTVMSGLLIGILLARTFSGAIAEIGGWRLVFVVSAVAMLVLAVVLHRALPVVAPSETLRYGRLLRSVLALVRDEPVLRWRMALGALSFAGFSALWTSIAFLLGGPSYELSAGVIGLFGLAGAAGALIAPVAGRLSDRGRGGPAMTAFLLITVAGWGLLALGTASVVAVVAGVVVFDLGAQGTHISNQARIYALRPEARNRMTTAYMVSYFLGGVAGSLVSAVAYDLWGWGAVCAVGAAAALGGLGVWAAAPRVSAR